MATTVNILCYKSKALSNGKHPLMIRICKDKKKYVSLGVSVKAEHWNFEKNIPKSNCPNKEYINILIANKKKEYDADGRRRKSVPAKWVRTSRQFVLNIYSANRAYADAFSIGFG